MHSTFGRRVWLDIASRVTGYEAKEHISVECHDFHQRIKLLVCPWIVIPRTLPLTIGPLMDTENMKITHADDDTIALWFKDDFSDEHKIVGTVKARPDDLLPPGFIPGIKPPTVRARKFFTSIQPPEQLRCLTNHDDSRYFQQHIHKSVFAVIEITAWDMEQRNGIYFFNKKNGKATRLLRHILIGV